VLGENVGVLGGVPDEERRRLGRRQRVERGRAAQLRAGVLAEQDQPGRTVGLGLHRGDGVAKEGELHRLIRCGAGCEGRQPGQMPSGGEPHQADALRALGPPIPDLGPQRVQRHRMADVERIAEHARLHAYLAEPAGHRLGLVRGVHRIPAAGQDDHVRIANRDAHEYQLPPLARAQPPRSRAGPVSPNRDITNPVPRWPPAGRARRRWPGRRRPPAGRGSPPAPSRSGSAGSRSPFPP